MQLVSIIIRQFIFVNSKTGQKFIKKGYFMDFLRFLFDFLIVAGYNYRKNGRWS